MRRSPSRVISARAVRELLRDIPHERDEERTRTFLGYEVLRLGNGGALLRLEHGRGRLYDSYADFCEALAQNEEEARRGARHMLSDLLSSNVTFPGDVPMLIERLPAVLPIDATSLDGSEASLKRIDRAIRTFVRGKSDGFEAVLTEEIVPSLIAYVGEVMRKATDGRWQMRLSDDGKVREPWIISNNGEEFPAFLFVKELLDPPRTVSIASFVSAQLAVGAWRSG